MNLLAIETSQNACSLALSAAGSIWQEHLIAPRQQAKLILKTIDQLLQAASLSVPELDAIAFGCGPGSFTGIRLAAGVAQGLALSVNRPVIPVSSLQVMAQAAYLATGIDQVVVAIDARQGEVYWGLYQFDAAAGLMLGVDAVGPPATVKIPDGQFAAVGNGWQVYDAAMAAHAQAVTVTINEPDAAIMLAIAKKVKNTLPASQGIPHYVRQRIAIDQYGQ